MAATAVVVGRVAALGAVDGSAADEDQGAPLLFHRGKFGRFSP